MATANKSATVQGEVSTVAAPVASTNEVKTAAQTAAVTLANALRDATFDELSKAIMTRAHWSDVLNAADRLAKTIKDAGIAEKTVSAQARKVGTLCPSDSMHFRLAITSYSLSGRTANPSQQAELAGKLPSLRKPGSLKANEATFGGIVLPPILGSF